MTTVPDQLPTVVLVPHWLSAVDRAALATLLAEALDRPGLPDLTAAHLEDVLT